jgi:hypothetical protein
VTSAARRACALALSAGVLLAAAARAEPTTELDAAATRLLEALPPEAREALRFPFDSGERGEIRFAPFGLDGLQMGDLDPAQAARVEELLAAGLSASGLEKVRSIRALEEAVRRKDAGSWLGWTRTWMRDPGRYFLALFGEPGRGAPWGLRFEGHHLSLHLTAAPGRIPASTPLFLGAEPRSVPEGSPGAGVRALGQEEDAARALYHSLDARATLPYAAGRELLLGDERSPERPEPVGMARAEMRADQRAALDALLDLYLDNFAAPIAAARRAEIDAAGRDAIRFAWAEADEPPHAFYYRIQGATFLIEVDNTTDGDHLHAVWRDFRGDWGADLLALHYERAHGLALGATASSSTPIR